MIALIAVPLTAATAAAWAGIWSVRYHRDRRDEAWVDDAVAYFARIKRMPEHPAIVAMRSVDRWPTTDRDFDDHADQAVTVAADEVTHARLEQAVHRRHPAGGAR